MSGSAAEIGGETPGPPASTRRHDLDWIRVGAFLLLILYHIGMFYVPWDWHVKSSHEVAALEPIMLLTNPWRLTLLFVVSGAATRFIVDAYAARGAGSRRLAGSRTLRLLPPLVLGMFVIVPPQSYYEVLEAFRTMGLADPAASPVLDNFWIRYATASGDWCDSDGCLITPTWNHLWFVAYLWIYSLILAFLLWCGGDRLRNLAGPLERALKGWGLILWPALWLILIRLVLSPLFETTHALVDDWYNHALSLSAFLFGFLIAKSDALKRGFMGKRRVALILGVVTWAAWATYAWLWRAEGAVPPEALRAAMRVVYGLNQWSWIAAVLGYGARYLTRGGPVLRYLTIGVFPFYIAHQTIIVVAGHHLANLRLPLAAEASILIVATFAGCLLTYEIARRLGWLGLLLGVRPRSGVSSVPPASPRLVADATGPPHRHSAAER